MSDYVVNQELCEQLVDLTGWGIKDEYINRVWSRNGAGEWYVDIAQPYPHAGQIPAYTLGFLFRKLSDYKSFDVRYIHPDNGISMDLKNWPGKFVALTPELPQFKYPVADTPEDALCELIINLFKEGVFSERQT